MARWHALWLKPVPSDIEGAVNTERLINMAHHQPVSASAHSVNALILAVAAWLFTRTLVSIPWDRIALLRAASPALLAFALALLLPEDGAWLVVRGILGVAAGGVALQWILGRGRTLGAPEAA